ncbi:MAG: DciA family protein [Campylobacterota bacterium]
MKKLNEILSHIKNNPEFRRVNTSTIIEQFINILPLKLKKGVKFAYVKNQTLYFVLKHPVYKMEFEYNKADIKSLLKKSRLEEVYDIKFFVTNKLEKKQNKQTTTPKYEERSFGIFTNLSKDEKLHNKFEQIRKIIKDS